MTGKRNRALALALVAAMVLTACGGGSGEEPEAVDAGTTDTSADTTDVAGAAEDGGADEAPIAEGDADSPAPAEGDVPADTSDGSAAPAGGQTPPAQQQAGAPAAAPLDDAGALARALRVEDLPSGYQKHDETVGESDDDRQFEDAFRRCMTVAGADPEAITQPTGQASRTFGQGSPNPQDPRGISSGVIGFADAPASERMVGELAKLFASEPGRQCIEDEMEAAIAEESGAVAPGATFTVDAQELSAYRSASAIAQLRLVITVDFGAQKLVFVSDLMVIRSGNAAALVGFTNADKAFDPKVGQPILDKALARLGG